MRTLKTSATTMWLFIVLVMGTGTVAHAAIPLLLNHQGVVSVQGEPFNGNGDFRFALLDPDDGANFWTNDGTRLGVPDPPEDPVDLPVINGIYNVRLGDITVPNMVALPSTAFKGSNIVLRIWFDDHIHDVQQLAPDQVLTSAPYAFHALIADTAKAAIADSISSSMIADGEISPADLQDGTALAEMLDDDGPGSGLDADTLDGLDSTDFAEGSHTHWGQDWSGNGIGLSLLSEDGDALYAMSNSTTTGAAVHGYAYASNGVVGESTASDKSGVYGHNLFGPGVRGRSESGDGVVGATEASDKSGVFGNTMVGTGVTGRSESATGIGVLGHATGDSGQGVRGEALATGDIENYGGWFKAAGNDGIAVYGTAPGTAGYGVYGSASGDGAGVRGVNSGSGPAIKAEGDLYVTGAFRGNIGASGGAPFPRPAYNSDWQAIADGGPGLTLQHNLGGSPDNYVVDLQFKSLIGINHFCYGGLPVTGHVQGAYWDYLTGTSIHVQRYTGDATISEIRVRIWVYN